MKKQIMLIVAIMLSISVIATTVSAAEGTTVSVYIDGELSGLTGRLYGTSTYVSVRGFAEAFGAPDYSRQGYRAEVRAPGLRLTAGAGEQYIVANGRYLLAPYGCFDEGGELYAPIRALAAAFDAKTYWSERSRAAFLVRGSGAIGPADYTAEDLYWMSRIIFAEARGESFLGKVAVGHVVMNRVAAPQFPGTVHGVIFDRASGVQFTPAYSGAVYNTPNEECVIAARAALDGAEVVGDSLYFSSTANCWAARRRPYVTTLGCHTFYA